MEETEDEDDMCDDSPHHRARLILKYKVLKNEAKKNLRKSTGSSSAYRLSRKSFTLFSPQTDSYDVSPTGDETHDVDTKGPKRLDGSCVGACVWGECLCHCVDTMYSLLEVIEVDEVMR